MRQQFTLPAPETFEVGGIYRCLAVEEGRVELEKLDERQVSYVDVIRVNGFDIDMRAAVVKNAEGKVLKVTRTEWRLLECMAHHVNHVVAYRKLLADAWGEAYTDDTQYLRVWVSRIRRWLGRATIENHIGVGYRLVGEKL